MPAGSKPGERRGGRKKGTPNRDKQALLDRMRDVLGDPHFDPVIAMAQLGHKELQLLEREDENASKEFALSALKESAQYVTPKLKAITHDGQVAQTIFVGADFGKPDK